MGLVDRFETGQKVLTDAPAGTAALTGPATALASPGASRTELIRVFYVVLYKLHLFYRFIPIQSKSLGIPPNCHDAESLYLAWVP